MGLVSENLSKLKLKRSFCYYVKGSICFTVFSNLHHIKQTEGIRAVGVGIQH